MKVTEAKFIWSCRIVVIDEWLYGDNNCIIRYIPTETATKTRHKTGNLTISAGLEQNGIMFKSFLFLRIFLWIIFHFARGLRSKYIFEFYSKNCLEYVNFR